MSSFKKKATGISRILITAGPTREKIDSVRFISNFSTGNMGYEIARASLAKGYKVTLISGPTYLLPPKGVKFVRVEETREMEKAVKKYFKSADCLFMASAVCDWRPEKRSTGKIKKGKNGSVTFRFVENPDILKSIGRIKNGKLLAGFALESTELIKNAKIKLREKNLDLIVANKVGGKSPFGEGKTDVVILDRSGRTEKIFNTSKRKIAFRLLDKAEKLWKEKG